MAYEFRQTRRVQFADTDMAGIVHFSRFFDYMEETEHAFLRSLGLSVHAKTPEGVISFPRVRAECDYRHPIRFEDEVDIHLIVRDKQKKIIVYDFSFTNTTAHPPIEAAHGRVTVVCVALGDKGEPMRSKPIPAALSEKIETAPE